MRKTAQLALLNALKLAGAYILVVGLNVHGQSSFGSSADAQPLAVVQGTVDLAQGWRFQTGDDPRWSQPGFDDASWPQVRPGTPLSQQGIKTYSGYAWYRLRLTAEQLATVLGRGTEVTAPGAVLPSQPLELLITSFSVGQLAVYIDGKPVASTEGMAKRQMYQSIPLLIEIPAAARQGGTVIAIRSWAGVPVSRGTLLHVQIGPSGEIHDRLELAIARTWDQHALSGILASFLFLCVACLGATLYLAHRNHSEYLWLTLLCLSVTLRGSIEVAFSLDVISVFVFNLIGNWTGWIFMATTLEFVYLFTGGSQRRMLWVVRTAQAIALLIPIAMIAQLEAASEYINIGVEVLFLTLAFALLFRAWRSGLGEAGAMLIPFLIAAVGDLGDSLLEVAVEHNLLPASYAPHPHFLGPVAYSNSTVCYLLFLGSLISVILYRFIRVSQEEQRSSAEIEAARSVQATLIPTQLPSTVNFMLESAYLPANVVGGDFFQVLPLKDDSMLIVVGDVSGKGLQAAMNASTLVGALRNELAHDPATVLNHLNQVMLGDRASRPTAGFKSNSVAAFATCLCARIYPNGQMTVANARHLSPYREGREMELAADLPLGILPNMQYEEASFELKVGDRLIFMSDGVVEATNSQGELFGFERTQQVSHEPAHYIAQVAQRFGQNDDITVVSLYFAAATSRRFQEHSMQMR